MKNKLKKLLVTLLSAFILLSTCFTGQSYANEEDNQAQLSLEKYRHERFRFVQKSSSAVFHDIIYKKYIAKYRTASMQNACGYELQAQNTLPANIDSEIAKAVWEIEGLENYKIEEIGLKIIHRVNGLIAGYRLGYAEAVKILSELMPQGFCSSVRTFGDDIPNPKKIK